MKLTPIVLFFPPQKILGKYFHTKTCFCYSKLKKKKIFLVTGNFCAEEVISQFFVWIFHFISLLFFFVNWNLKKVKCQQHAKLCGQNRTNKRLWEKNVKKQFYIYFPKFFKNEHLKRSYLQNLILNRLVCQCSSNLTSKCHSMYIILSFISEQLFH